MDSFDPYHKWLGIPKKEQPANHYRLLGITVFEPDLDVIEAAADRQMAYVSQCATGEHLKLSQQILNELSAARVCLLVPAKREVYDEQLRKKLGRSTEASALPIREPEPVDEFDQTFETLRPAPRRKKSRSQKPEIPYWMLAGGGVAVVVSTIGLWSMMGNTRSSKSRIRSDLESPPVAVIPAVTPVEQSTTQNTDRSPLEKPVDKIAVKVETGNLVANATDSTIGLEVIEARYGTLDRWTDLTDRARVASRSGILGMVVDGGLVGGDPYPGVQKYLHVRYRVRGHDYDYLAPDFHSTFVIDTRPKPVVDPKGGLLIHEAWYSGNISGESERIDVADRLRTAVHDGRLQANLAQVVEGLPNRRILFVRWSVRGEVWTSSFELDETIDLGPETPAVINLASRRASRSGDKQSLMILEVKYGRGNQWIDLTDKVGFAERKGVIAFLADGTTVSTDPVPNIPKMVRVRYQAEGMLFDELYFNGSFIYFDARADQPSKTGSGLTIIQAICGHGVYGDPKETMIDVTDHLQKQVRENRLVQSFDAAVQDVAGNINPKRLLVRYAHNGQVRIVVFNQGDEIRLGAE
ncbi:MAG: hypothetical protein JWP89_233 [Schlesneria sp.]|nr:hypothetical protein [Schlesneria sp.]